MAIFNKNIRGATLAVFLLAAFCFASVFILSRPFLPWWLFLIPLLMLLMPLIYSIDKKKPEAVTVTQPEQNVAPAPEVVILITGPWAASWFDKQQAAIGSRFDHHITWLLTPSAADIDRRLEKLYETGRLLDVSLYFPFLPDGFDNESLMISQLTAWKNSLFGLKVAEKLPCTLAIYTRLSHERKSHNPDYACWAGNVELSQQTDLPLSQALEKLLRDQESHRNGEPCHVEQRNAMTTLLASWLTESKIVDSLHAFFDAAGPLTLNRLLIADHGYGFSRHGAWSNWLCDEYGLLPGLASSVSRPPLPVLRIPREPQQAPAIPETPAPAPAPRPASPWLSAIYAVSTLLALLLLSCAWKQSEMLIKAQQNLYQFENIDVAALAEKMAMMESIKQDKHWLSDCVKKPFLSFILFTRPTCEKLLTDSDNKITQFYAAPLYESVSLFARGSAVLTPETEKSLAVLIPLIRENPDVRFLITGHSDNTGTPEFNQKLSLERAIVVRDWLIQETHSSQNRFITEGAADARPVATNVTEDGRKLNRRVEIKPLP